MSETTGVQPDAHCVIDHNCATDEDNCEHEPKWWTCRYYQTVDRPGVKTEMCSFGCWEEPNCVTGQPTEGWPEQ